MEIYTYYRYGQISFAVSCETLISLLKYGVHRMFKALFLATKIRVQRNNIRRDLLSITQAGVTLDMQ
jgi:hypothetical protein